MKTSRLQRQGQMFKSKNSKTDGYSMHKYKQLYTKLYSKDKSKRMPKGESVCFYINIHFLNLCLKLFHVFVCVSMQACMT